MIFLKRNDSVSGNLQTWALNAFLFPANAGNIQYKSLKVQVITLLYTAVPWVVILFYLLKIHL